MFLARGPGGPKSSTWTRAPGQQIGSFFGRAEVAAEREPQLVPPPPQPVAPPPVAPPPPQPGVVPPVPQLLVAVPPPDAAPDGAERTALLARDRAKHEARHATMRELINWLVAHRFRNIQRELVDTLGLSPVFLSQYKSGKAHGGNINLVDLGNRYDLIKRALARAGLPLEIPSAAVISTASATTHATRESGGVPPLPRQPPLTSNPPLTGKSILTRHLCDVEGAKAGGQIDLMSLGVPVNDTRWRMERPGGGSLLYLRDGLRGRRMFAARKGSTMGGRIFEWWIETLDARHDLVHH